MGDSLSPLAGARGWRPLGKGLGRPSGPPAPPGCVSVCSVLDACGNWAQAQGELTVQTQDGSGGRVREGRDEEGWTQNRGLFVFPGGAELGPCTSHVSIRAQAAKKPGIVGGLRHPHGPSAPAGKNGGPLKDRISDPSQCEQVYSGGTPHFWLYRQWGDTGTSGMHDSRKLSPGSTRTNHSSSSSSAMPRARLSGVRAGATRWMEMMPLSKA